MYLNTCNKKKNSLGFLQVHVTWQTKKIFRLTSVGLLLLTDVSIGLPGLQIGRPETVICIYVADFGQWPQVVLCEADAH